MSEIQRWTPELVRYFNKVGPGLAKHEIGSYVLWTDHVAAMQAAHPKPTPAELIPTLKEHEWVRVKYCESDEWSVQRTVYVEGKSVKAGAHTLQLWNGETSASFYAIERCDAPAVVK